MDPIPTAEVFIALAVQLLIICPLCPASGNDLSPRAQGDEHWGDSKVVRLQRKKRWDFEGRADR